MTKKRRIRLRRRTAAEILGPKVTRNILQRPWEARPNLDGCNDLQSMARAIGGPLILARCIFGNREVAREMLRRLREAVEERGIEYRRDRAIAAIANYLKMDSQTLTNWLNRSRSSAK
jgi:hypothetical protein